MSENWSNMSERGSIFWIKLAGWIHKTLGRKITLVILFPFVLFFYLSGQNQRRASMSYLSLLHANNILPAKPSFFDGIRHFMAFAGSLLDRLAAWTGKISPDQVEGVEDEYFSNAKFNGKGGLILTGHLGNPDLIRAVATVNERFPVTVLMHTKNAEKYNSVINEFSPKSSIRIVEVSRIDVHVAMQLSESIERGEWVVVAADRLPPKDDKNASILATLLGQKVRYPIGPYILASALKCPVYFLVCFRTNKTKPFSIVFRKIADQISLSRKNRQKELESYANKYSECMAAAIEEAPFQWFNFFDFWDTHTTPKNPRNQ